MEVLRAGMSSRLVVVVGRRGEVGVGDIAGLRLNLSLDLAQVLLQLPEIVVRQHDRMPAVLLGHRAILGQRVGMSRRRDWTMDAGRMKPKVARANWAETCTGERTAVIAGVITGIMAVAMADVIAGAIAAAVTGVVTGAAAGVVTDAATGVATGVMAGVVTGVIAGVMAGVVAGVIADVMTGAIAGVVARAMTGVATGLITGVMTGAAIPPTRVSFPGK